MKIYSENVNGIGSDKVKRQAIFNKLKRKESAVFMMQETHCTLELEEVFKTEFGSKKNVLFKWEI